METLTQLLIYSLLNEYLLSANSCRHNVRKRGIPCFQGVYSLWGKQNIPQAGRVRNDNCVLRAEVWGAGRYTAGVTQSEGGGGRLRKTSLKSSLS